MIRIDKGNLNAVIYRGEKGKISVRYSDIDFVDGDKIYLTVKETVEDETPVLSIEAEEINEDGSCDIIILPEDTSNIEPGTYVYDITVVKKDGDVDTITNGEKLPTFEIKVGSTNG